MLRVAGAPDEEHRQLTAALALYREGDGRYLPSGTGALLSMGNHYFVKKDYPAAERYFRQALEACDRAPTGSIHLDGTKEVLLNNLSAALDWQGRKAEATSLVDQVLAARLKSLDASIARGPPDAGLHAAREAIHLNAGRFREALADCAAQVPLAPGNSAIAYRHCALLLYLGEHDAYLRARREMLLGFSDSNNPEDRERAAKAHFISPDPGDEAQRLASLVDGALNNAPATYLLWFRMTKALTEYRSGRLEAAVAWCERARGVGSASAQFTLDLLTEMSRHRLAPGPDARGRLEAVINSAARRSTVQGWEHHALAEILLKEAREMLGPGTRPAKG
jgi:tetratricopeptide (TPR) repeat protein